MYACCGAISRFLFSGISARVAEPRWLPPGFLYDDCAGPNFMKCFHAAAIDLLTRPPKRSESATAEVVAAERRLGVALPPSVRDWYTYENAMEILAEHSNEDPPIAPAGFATIEWQSNRLLPIRRENQGVCTWAIALNGSDDPPVMVDVDSGGAGWQLFAHRFSDYVYACLWDYRRVLFQPGQVQAQNGVLSDVTLAALSAKYTTRVKTHGWPGSTQYRFDAGEAAILIWAAPDQADWFVGASTDAASISALKEVSDLDHVGAAFYDCTPIGRAALDELQRTK